VWRRLPYLTLPLPRPVLLLLLLAVDCRRPARPMTNVGAAFTCAPSSAT